MRPGRIPVFAVALLVFSAGAAAGDEVVDGVAGARALLDRGEVEACVAELARLREVHGDDPRVLRLQAFVRLEKEGRPEEAAEILELLLRRFPGDRYSLDLLTTICDRAYEECRFEASLGYARLLVELEPDEKEHALRWAWASYRLGQDPGGVRSACRAVIDRYPSFDRAYWLVARVYEDQGDFEAAVEVYRELLEEYPGDVYVRLTMAYRLLWDMREYDLAEDAFRSALEISETGSAYRRDAEDGILKVRELRERAERLGARHSFLAALLVAVLAAWSGLFAALLFVTRRARAAA